MRYPSLLFAGFVFVLIMSVFSATAPAQDSGLTKLLDIFESKGILTADEVKLIREAAARDMQAPQKKEPEISRRVQELPDREKQLTQGEKEPSDETSLESSIGEPESTTAASQSAGRSQPEPDHPAAHLKAVYDKGFCLQADNLENLEMCLGGLLQTDYRYYDYDEGDPDNNRFDIRRARLRLSGSLLRYMDYKFDYEFAGTSSRNLLDAYADIHALPAASLRLGQFKEPFGLEQVSPVANIFFNERSFGFYLTPKRDVGAMVHGSILDDRLNYAIGAFNGDGPDDSVGADSDYPQVTGRLVLAPFRNRQLAVGENLQFGGSFSYLKIDSNNVDVQVKTAGLTTFFDVSPGAKFAVIRDADKLYQYSAELGWAMGSVALMSEYIWVRYQGIESSSTTLDLDMDAYYAALIWMMTGERPAFRQGVIQPIVPAHSIGRGGWGAWGLGLRFDHFEAGNNVYGTLVEPGDSVREANAFTAALNWYLTKPLIPMKMAIAISKKLRPTGFPAVRVMTPV